MNQSFTWRKFDFESTFEGQGVVLRGNEGPSDPLNFDSDASDTHPMKIYNWI